MSKLLKVSILLVVAILAGSLFGQAGTQGRLKVRGGKQRRIRPTPLPPQIPGPDLRGIYVYSGDISQISAQSAQQVASALAVSGTDGIVLVIGWNAIETAKGQYQWDTLNHWMKKVAAGKKIDLVIKAGNATPSWLFTAGATPLTFTVAAHQGKGKPITEVIAAPWDPVFLSNWDSMLGHLAANLKQEGTYNSVSLVRITGINRTTDEFRLPAETPENTGNPQITDSIAIWQKAGYKPSMLLRAWDRLTGSFQKSFPDKAFSIAMIPYQSTHQYPFPPIGEDGQVIKGNVPDQNQPLLALASHKFPGRLVVQFNFLLASRQASRAVTKCAQTLGTLAAYQTNNWYGSSGGGAAASGTASQPVPCTAPTYLQLLENGIYPFGKTKKLRSQYIEVFPANVIAFPEDVSQAHIELVPPQSRSGG